MSGGAAAVRELRRPPEDEGMFRRAFGEAPVAAAIVDPAGVLVEVNRALGDLLGYPAGALAGRTLADLAPPREEPLGLDGLGRVPRDRCVVRVDAEPLWVAVSAAPIVDPDGGVRFHVVQMENIADRKRVERTLRTLADHDALTGLLNRRRFLEAVRGRLSSAARTGESAALLLLDLDDFKQVNDTAGHAAGDAVLRTAADVLLRQLVGPGDLAGRLGGDEFAALLPDVAAERAREVAGGLAETLRDAGIEASVGVAMFGGLDETEDELIARADRAMYADKSSRRR